MIEDNQLFNYHRAIYIGLSKYNSSPDNIGVPFMRNRMRHMIIINVNKISRHSTNIYMHDQIEPLCLLT